MWERESAALLIVSFLEESCSWERVTAAWPSFRKALTKYIQDLARHRKQKVEKSGGWNVLTDLVL